MVKDEPNESTPLAGEKSDETTAELSWTVICSVFVVIIGSSFQFGYGTGVTNNSAQYIMKHFHDQGKKYTLLEWGTTVSCFGIGGLIGSVLGPKFFGKRCGRKATLIVNNIFLIISSILIAYAPVWWFQAIGRVFVGIVAGIATAVVPTYLNEISSIELRGAIGTMHQLGITLGILTSQVLSTPSLHLFGSESKWKWLFFVPVLCGLFEVVLLPFCPESPSYLYDNVGKKAAKDALVRLHSEEEAEEHIDIIEEETEANEGCDDVTVLGLFKNRTLRKQLIVGIMVQLMMQFSGINAILYYSTLMFEEANIADPELATTCLGLLNVIVTVIAARFMDVTGRKTLLTISWIGMCTSYILLTISSVFKGGSLPFMEQLSIVATALTLVFFAIGPGCIAWFLIAEIFPLHARDTASTIGIFTNWAANSLIAFAFPMVLKYTQPYTYLLFVGTTAYFLYFTIRFIPETKGLNINQVTNAFNSIPLSTC